MATISDLTLSITELPMNQVLELIADVRKNRRISKGPIKQAAKVQPKTGNKVSKTISKMDAETAAQLLNALEALLK
jgi:hypothetical protein